MIKIKSGESKVSGPTLQAIPEKKRVGRPPLSAAAKQLRVDKLEQKKAAIINKVIAQTKPPVPSVKVAPAVVKKPTKEVSKESKMIDKAALALVANKTT